MTRLAVSKDYFAAYAHLPRKAQRKADELLVKFQRDSTSLGIHLEPIHGCVDKQLRSARIGDDYRVILRAPEIGDVFLVLWADHHDEAYRWAATKQTAVHPATGSLQVFDTATIEPSSPSIALEAPGAAATQLGGEQLFHSFDDETLFLAGVPLVLLPSIRAIRSDSELDAMLPHLPPEAGEVLTGLASGLALDEVLEEVLGRTAVPPAAPTQAPIDTSDVVAALARESTQRQFRLLDGELDLDAALKHPLDAWRVFLHPRQKRIARAHTKGPVRVLGGAGTGKTVVALHRAGFLVTEVFTKPDDRVLFTTFNVNLATDLRLQLGKLLEPDHLARVEVVNIDAWAAAYLRKRGVTVRTAFEDEQREHFQSAYDVYGEDGRTLEFHRAEWREVIQEQGLRTEDEYVFAVRRHRGLPLSRTERRTMWPVFQAYRESLDRDGFLEPIDVLRRARAELEAAGAPPHYRSIVVDEVQDFSAEALKLVRAIAGPERPDDLFLVGDAHQRIYRRPTSLSSCGIQVRGRRSQTLRLNYRTTGAICRWSLGVLDGIDVDDLDEGKADRRGYVSLREGPAPSVQCLSSQMEEEKAIAQLVGDGLGVGWIPEGVCIVARTHRTLTERICPALTKAGIEWVTLEKEEPRRGGVRVATMHRVKGLEFPVVILAGMSKGEVPLQTPELTSDDPLVAELALLREKSLLYVAASRARDELHVFAAGELTPLLSNLTKVTATDRAKPRPPTVRPPPPRTVPPPAAPSVPAASLATNTPEVPPPQPLHAIEAEVEGHTTVLSSATVSSELAALLLTPVDDLDLPTRMLNFATEKGVVTVLDLVRWTQPELMAQRNLGRKTVRVSREAIEDLTGRRWEDLTALDRSAVLAAHERADAEVSDADVADAVSLGTAHPADLSSMPWDALRQALSITDRLARLERIPLPTRARGFATTHGLQTLGELAKISAAELAKADNFGRKTIKELPKVIAEHLTRRRAEERLADEGFVECWLTLLEGLDRIPRIVLTRRSGLVGPVETLKEIGEMLGVSRERIRQIEAAAIEELTLRSWVDVAQRRVDDVVADGGRSLADLENDAWWREATRRPEVTRYLVESVLEANTYIITFDDETWISRHKESVVEEAWLHLRNDASAVALPAPQEAFDALVRPIEVQLGSAFATAFRERLRELTIADESDPGRVVAVGGGRIAKAMALLRSSPVPVHASEVEAAIGGRHHFPDEMIRFGDGRVGLREHIPDFETWQTQLVPAAADIMRRVDPDRQWSCNELLDELRDEHAIPEWLNPFVLAALIKAGSELHYLGRLRVALPGTKDDTDRIYLHELMEEILREAGEPLARDEIVSRIRARIGITDLAINQAITRPEFVRVDLDRIGLVERDVPGGQAAIDEARDEAATLLERRDRGLSIFHVHEEVSRLSAAHEQWTRELTSSILHGDPRFRFSQSGAMGLASWESTRVPTRLELVRSALEEAGDRVSVEAITARVEAHYGEPIGRGFLASIAAKLGASLAGEWIVRKTDGL
jgi:superfamily I DNA/RNA helicase/mRNA-degrading endonuclease RelE of RelBE toxin-antitoxin system